MYRPGMRRVLRRTFPSPAKAVMATRTIPARDNAVLFMVAANSTLALCTIQRRNLSGVHYAGVAVMNAYIMALCRNYTERYTMAISNGRSMLSREAHN